MREMPLTLTSARDAIAYLESFLNNRAGLLFRAVLVLCQAITIILTWRLWQTRDLPPTLPALPLPQIDTGLLLLGSLLIVLVVPLPGLVIHSLLLTYAIASDQTRLQPEIISLLILMWGTLESYGLKMIARGHLIALWFFAGFNKLISSGYWTGLSFAHPLSASRVALLPFVEIALGVLTLLRRTRKIAIVLAFVLHIGIFMMVAVRLNRNSAIWFWNVGLAFAAIALLYPWNESFISSVRKLHPVPAVLVLLILVSPIGFYFGIVDAYLAHNLYSRNVPYAVWHTTAGERKSLHTVKPLNVPLPPEHRLFESSFQQLCSTGDYLLIHDPRWWARARGYERRRIECGR